MELDFKNRENNSRRFSIQTAIALILALSAIFIVFFAHRTIKSQIQVKEENIVVDDEKIEDSSNAVEAERLRRSISIIEIGKDLTDVYFPGHIVHKGGNPKQPDINTWALLIRWGKNAPIKKIPYGGYIRGYKLFPFVKKGNHNFIQKLMDAVFSDRWFLIMQKKGHKPIIIEMWGKAVVEEFYAKLKSVKGGEKDAIPDKLYEADKFELNGEKVVVTKISEEEVTLIDCKNNVIKIKKAKWLWKIC